MRGPWSFEERPLLAVPPGGRLCLPPAPAGAFVPFLCFGFSVLRCWYRSSCCPEGWTDAPSASPALLGEGSPPPGAGVGQGQGSRGSAGTPRGPKGRSCRVCRRDFVFIVTLPCASVTTFNSTEKHGFSTLLLQCPGSNFSHNKSRYLKMVFLKPSFCQFLQ